MNTIPALREVGKREFFVLDGPFAEFDPDHPSVEVWTPAGNGKAPLIVYAHGGAGFREDDFANSLRSETITVSHRETGISVEETIPLGNYPKKQMQAWLHQIETRLSSDIRLKVDKAQRLPRRP